MSTYEVETLDNVFGRALGRETRLYTGVAGGAVLGAETRSYDSAGRLLTAAYSDGTAETNVWDCCHLQAKIGRDGAHRDFISEPGKDHESAVAETSLALLPGSGGHFPVTEKCTDALGRETNSVRCVWHNGSRDTAYAPLSTRTEYPYGTDNYTVTTDPLGVQSVSRRYYGNSCVIDETVSAGVTNRTTQVWGGSTIGEKFWDGKWTRETRSTSYNENGCRVETVTKEASDMPGPVMVSETAYDFLGRVVSVITPLGVTSNFYDGASARLVRVSRTGSPDTLYVYDELGNATATALDVDGDGQVSYAGDDRISANETRYEENSNVWWRVTASAVWHQTGTDASLTASVSRVRMTGLGGAASSPLLVDAVLTAQSETLDWRGKVTRTSTYNDAGSAALWQVTQTPVSTQPVLQKAVGGITVFVVSATCVTNTFAFDGFARQTAVTDGRGNTSRTVYNAIGLVEYTENAASNRTVYAYDELSRQVSVSAPLSNTVFTAYDSLGNVIRTWGATYPVEYGYDSQGRKISMKTFREENGTGDETLWLYNDITGLLTNKVYADGKGTAYTYTQSGRLASRVWARGVTTAYTIDALGQLTGIDYGDATPDITFTYDRIGNMVSVSDASGTRVFIHDLDGQTLSDTLSALGQEFMLLESRDVFGRNNGYTVSNTVNSVTSHITGMAESYDPFGRLAQVSVVGVNSPFRYGYLPGTDLQQTLIMPNSVTRETAYAAYLDLSESIIHTNSEGTVLTRRLFARDTEGNLSKRTQYRLGDATNRVDMFAHNGRGELVSADIGTNGYSYTFDPIGNRMTAVEPEFFAAYSANSLNQYTRIFNSIPPADFIPEFDADGNQTLLRTATGIWRVTYNAENRPVIFSNDTVAVEMAYDYQGRRFDYTETDNGTVVRHERYLYRGYLQIAALDLLDGTNVLHTVAWDPSEPAATRPLVLKQGTNWWSYGFDHVKNVTELFDHSGIIAATYEYAPFGAITASSGSAAAVNPITFSSEIGDIVLGLVYYNYRPLSVLEGRWLSRDPIEEEGCLNLYDFGHNDIINNIDMVGLITIGNKIFIHFGVRAARSFTFAGRLFNRFTQGPDTMSDDENEMNSALDFKIKQILIHYIRFAEKEGTVKINNVDLNRVYSQITYDSDTSDFKTGWWLNGAHKVIANGEARCVTRSGGKLSIGSVSVGLVWHDWIDANPSGENFIKNALETAFGVYDKFGFVSWEIRIPWHYEGKNL